MNPKVKHGISRTFFYIALLLFLIFIIIPIYWCIVTSFKHSAEITSSVVTYWPKQFTVENYINAWLQSGFEIYFRNSLFISVIGVVFIVVISVLSGYALARFKFKGKNVYMLILLCTQFIPGAMLLTPMFLIFKNLGLLNNLFGIVLVDVTFHVPFNAIMMRGFISGIDYTIEEAAQIDGCSRLQAVCKVLLPILKPGIATVAAYSFISCWNEFLFTFMFISKQNLLTLPVGLKNMVGEYTINYGQLAAGAIIAVIPTLILFSFVQKNLVGGLSAGAVKG
ncbi:MAG: carbohydrate ABC transporter permease [Lachnospiraceae bacterium]|jgi:multiple sugar transport system permease protein|nr:carbohydrate ABC transporter permease [Lachnospiraceae bacterium]MCH4031439.1 carbohydrate ABC transporter permease [Lachnospiraceae bacterium]MCH4071006.1 carbohydrate ABC transporter permease [Lachnospiraceae bacterium]MCH4107993.1 carbohydrate ABC transporter permease [Lachnospiraceae bacterium]MCI1302461.1 carbohydrate ABC transporter permease [Lachnospiraceae bacterium]